MSSTIKYLKTLTGYRYFYYIGMVFVHNLNQKQYCLIKILIIIMSRLNLDAFKAQAETQTQELEELSGGILGACHCTKCTLLTESNPSHEDGSLGYNIGVGIAHLLGWHDE